MKHINELKDIGKDKDCLIIGGGHSVNDFDFEKIPNDLYIISINNHMCQMANMIIYYDIDMMEYFDKHCIADNTILVGFQHDKINHLCDKCSYYYTYDDIDFGDSGFHVLHFADKIFNFKKTYLIGYDYQVKGKSYHYDEELSDSTKQKNFICRSIDVVLPVYKTTKYNNKIYNCSKDSALKVFKCKLPY
jgi:hypothetical protein